MRGEFYIDMFLTGLRGELCMTLAEVLSAYGKGELNRFAKDKVVGPRLLSVEELRSRLAGALDNLERVRTLLTQLRPPGNIVIDILLEREGYEVPHAELERLVRQRVEEVFRLAASREALDPKKSKAYDLYGAVLSAAWESEDTLVAAEWQLLQVLRRELNLTMQEHRIIEARLDRLQRFSQPTYMTVIDRLTEECIVFLVQRRDEPGGATVTHFVIPKEIARLIKRTRGIELDEQPFRELLEDLTGGQLYAALKRLGLRLSGDKAERVGRVLQSGSRPSSVLGTLNVGDLARRCRKLALRASGSKAELIERLVKAYEEGRPAPAEPEEEEGEVEVRAVGDAAYREALTDLTHEQLYRMLKRRGLKVSGSKDAKIEEALGGPYALKTMLGALKRPELGEICKRLGRPAGNKPYMVDQIVAYYGGMEGADSRVSPERLVEIYAALARLDAAAYEAIGANPDRLTIPMIARDFEKATVHTFQSVFHMQVVPSRAGERKWDGEIQGTDTVLLWDCKSTSGPAYNLPNAHQRAFREYVARRYKELDAPAKGSLKCFIIIAPRFADRIERRLDAIQPSPPIPFCLLEAADLQAVAREWAETRPGEVFPCTALVHAGRLTRREISKRVGLGTSAGAITQGVPL